MVGSPCRSLALFFSASRLKWCLTISRARMRKPRCSVSCPSPEQGIDICLPFCPFLAGFFLSLKRLIVVQKLLKTYVEERAVIVTVADLCRTSSSL